MQGEVVCSRKLSYYRLVRPILGFLALVYVLQDFRLQDVIVL